MSILIKGMEMPTNCWDCYFQDCGNCRLNAHKVVDKCIIEDRRDEDCPLVPVPPHGRLIDADKIYDAVEQRYRISSGIEHRCERDLLDLICFAPTIIEAEEGE